MMNELYFLLHIVAVSLFALASLAIGKYALITYICTQSILANLFVVKQITLFGMDVTCGDVFIVGAVLGLNLLQEYFGKQIVIKTVWISFFISVFYIVMSQFHLLYLPNSFDTTHHMFSGILQFVPRITLASIFVSLLVQRVDCKLYGFLKNRFASKYLVSRNMFSIFCTQLLDTVLFSFAGLYGIVGSVLSVMTLSFVIKVVVIFVATPFVALSKKIAVKYGFVVQGAVLDLEKDKGIESELRG